MRFGNDRQRRGIGVVCGVPVPPAIGGNRRQLCRAQIPVDLTRHAIAVHVRLIMAIRLTAPREGGDRRERVTGEARCALGKIVRDHRAIVIGTEIACEDVEDVVLFLAREIADDAKLEIGRRSEQQLSAHAPVRIVLCTLVLRQIVQEASPLGRRTAEPDREQVVDQSARRRSAQLVIAIVADARLARKLGIEAWLLGRDVDRARGGVLAEQRPLRAAQHLDLLQVDQVELRLAGAPIIDVVDIEADAVLQPVIGQRDIAAKAADIDIGVARVEAEHLQAGHDLLDLGQRIIARGLQRFGADDGQRDRHILRAFVAAAGGHDDHAAVIFARGLGCGIRRVGGGRHIDSGGLEFGGRSGRGRQQQRCSKEKLQAMIGRETVHVIWSPGGVPAPFLMC